MTSARAIFFGSKQRPLFGWLHSVPAPARLGVVICSPFGYEAICAHRSIRHLAERSAAAGMPALRFDYDGTGNSAGDDFEPGRLGAWVASVREAIKALRELTGIEKVALIGLRLGATLAALAAEGGTEIAALIAIAPAISAKSYLRELRMLQLATDAKRGSTRSNSDSWLETCGFLVSAETQKSLSDIDLSRRTALSVPQVFILERAGFHGGERWAQQLRNHGIELERQEFQGYAEMMLDSHDSVVPEAMIQTVTDWLSRVMVNISPHSSPAAATQPFDDPCLIEPDVTEHAARFGADQRLFGIVSAPKAAAKAGNRKGILLLNAGAVHHVGPNRMYVGLARRWAKLGHVVLRFDLSGIGDSPASPGMPENVVYSPAALDDIKAASEYLSNSWGATELHAVGVCAGAYHAFKAAVAQLPLTGVVLINPLVFYWRDGMSLKYPEHRIAADIMRYQTNAFRLASWIKLLRGEVHLGELFQVLARRTAGLAFEPLRAIGHILRIPMHKDLGADLGRVADQGVGLQFVFAEQEPGIELVRNKGGYAARRLRSKGRLNIHVIPDADHTFTDRAPREALMAFLAEKLDGPARSNPS
jgi:pimeloyl-ACP methyl ester carboxylesterase